MPRPFDVSVESPATVGQVYGAFGDEGYWLARFAAFGISCTLDTLIVNDDGALTVSVTQDLRHDALPGPVAAIYPGSLTLLSTETWQPIDDRRVRGDVRIEVAGASGSSRGAAILAPNGTGSRLRFTGSVQVRIPLLGGRVESYLAGQFAEQIAAIQRFTSEWIAELG